MGNVSENEEPKKVMAYKPDTKFLAKLKSKIQNLVVTLETLNKCKDSSKTGDTSLPNVKNSWLALAGLAQFSHVSLRAQQKRSFRV